MRSLKDRGRQAERLALVLCGALVMALLIGFHVVAQTDPPTKTVAARSCIPLIRGAPCLGPLQNAYAYDGYGGSEFRYIRAKAGKQTVIGKVYESKPFPGLYEVAKRTFTWHSVANITIVAVFIVRGSEPHITYQRVRSGPHSGHTTLTSVRGSTPPALLLEGRH